MKTRAIPRLIPLMLVLGPSLAFAQEAAAPSKRDPISIENVREIVFFLASDDLAGRNTPSKGLDAAADYIARRFAAAGLKPLLGGSYFQRYEIPGYRLDSSSIEVSVIVDADGKIETVSLEPDKDVRLLRGADIEGEADRPATILFLGDPRGASLWSAAAGRQAMVLEVEETDPRWVEAAGEHETIVGGRGSSRPVFVTLPGRIPRPLPEFAGKTSHRITWKARPPARVALEARNVVGYLPGRKDAENLVISAHYDHLGIGRPVGGDAIYNGADDDASGTTAVVLIAEALARAAPFRRGILFTCFSGEEKGLLGSRAFAADPPVPLASIAANLNIEMIGRPEPGKRMQAWITGADYSDFASVVGPALAREGIELVDFRLARMLFQASDNFSLAAKGVVAHSISAGSLHQDYHRPSDEVAKLDLEHMTAVIRGLSAAARDLAELERPLSYNGEGRKVVERAGRPR